MGSYLTIVNDTPNDWMCKVGTDMHTVGVVGFVAFLSSLLIVTIPFVGPIAIVAGIAYYTHVPADKLSVRAAEGAVEEAKGKTVSDFSLAVSESLVKTFQEKGYDLIKAGENKRYGKMTLSLWQQSACIKHAIDGTKVRVETLFMRPIFSGAKKDSNRDYNIQRYIDKAGITVETIDGTTGDVGSEAKRERVLQEDDTSVYST